MKVLKFGGTSVGSAQRMKEVSKLITSDNEPKLVVLSAMSGTTNTLVEISDYLYKKNPEGANTVINQLEQKYLAHIDELYATDEWRQRTEQFLKEEFAYLRSMTKTLFTSFEEKVILAQGEIISTNMVTNYLQEQGIKAVLLSALDMIRTDKNAEPDFNYIREKALAQLTANPDYEIYITQGFICRNAYGEIDNLLRGGSDYTACLLGAAIEAEEIQIWTDIDTRPACLALPSKPRRFRSGLTSMVCTTTTPASSRAPSLCVSSTSKKLPSWPISAPRFCIRPAYSRLSSLAYPYVCSTPWTPLPPAPSSTTACTAAPSRP